MVFLGLMVRCKNEPYVKEFVEHYLREGVDEIHILDDNSDPIIYKDVIHLKNIHIKYNYNLNKTPGERLISYYNIIKNKFIWLVLCDMDEYITTKKNDKHTIRKELETTFKDCDCIKIPWVMMSCNSIKKNPISLLETNVYRWNHDKKHEVKNIPHKFRCRYNVIEVKSIFKPSKFNTLNDHIPGAPYSKFVNIVDSINKNTSLLNSFYSGLREKNIANAYLICYHYRIVSIEQCLNKIKYNIWYKHFTLQQLLSFDFPELIDETLKIKSSKKNN